MVLVLRLAHVTSRGGEKGVVSTSMSIWSEFEQGERTMCFEVDSALTPLSCLGFWLETLESKEKDQIVGSHTTERRGAR
ncbi:hypothetical protein BM1_10270 [Bipolaris maydis]|nr:hypothetical protein BM1_10270 [Bipolaris maydis]